MSPIHTLGIVIYRYAETRRYSANCLWGFPCLRVMAEHSHNIILKNNIAEPLATCIDNHAVARITDPVWMINREFNYNPRLVKRDLALP